MELQHIFLFTAVASALLIVLQSFRSNASASRRAALFVLLISGIAWLIVRPIAGYIAGIAWAGLLLIPAIRRRSARALADPFYSRRWSNISVSPIVVGLVVVNCAVFVLEIFSGGAQNPLTLYRLGELDTTSVVYGGQYWRFLSALFLHYGVLHLIFNMFALLVLGPPLERQIGGLPFAICYLLSGISSSVIVVLLAKLRLLPPLQLVGASGCVMGIVGTWAGFLLRNRHAPLAAERFRNIVVIIFLQIAFDIVTPDVSMAAHLGGLFTGFLIGLAIPAPVVRGI